MHSIINLCCLHLWVTLLCGCTRYGFDPQDSSISHLDTRSYPLDFSGRSDAFGNGTYDLKNDIDNIGNINITDGGCRIITLEVDAKQHCVAGPPWPPVASFTTLPQTKLPQGDHYIEALGGALNYSDGKECWWSWHVSINVSGWTNPVSLSVPSQEKTCKKTNATFWPTSQDVTAAAKGKKQTFTLNNAADAYFFLQDSNCKDNIGKLTFRVVSSCQ